jgi:hypothetical protein
MTLMRTKRTPKSLRLNSLESLEDRSLLHGSIQAIPSAQLHELAKSKASTIQGNFSGQTTDSYLVGSTSLYIAYQTSGHAAKVGNLTFDGAEIVAGTSVRKKFAVQNGAATLALPKGTLIVEYTGTQTYHSGKDTFKINGQVVAGSGIYAGATGSLSGTGSFKVSGVKFHLNVKFKG